ncbi:Sterol 3-beta-glucosyltransferase UGT80A2 [Camellia lanceoleosa]|uniref:Sterol 3-beta-glucosyltransferase UGT80A2 n=1 Tax=Camellia lanceoleosa TaxID=1840588 RepID=A0ACC0F603_9ERIC|nr:Sterol 3-beta-glucosyltransferase UGT80A2 [Camellia lanceoleosa]
MEATAAVVLCPEVRGYRGGGEAESRSSEESGRRSSWRHRWQSIRAVREARVPAKCRSSSNWKLLAEVVAVVVNFDGGEAVAGDGALSNGGGNSAGTADNGRNVPRINTSLVEILSADVSEPPSSQVKLEISKTEKYRNNNILAEEAAQIFDDKIPVQQKLKLLNRIATVKDDGTVEFEVPGDVEPHTFGVGSGTVYNGADDEPLELTDPQYIPPLQIVILIVGTRGDVQTFIAIGKRLQDYGHHVRLATHSNFKDFVLTAGLEFYPLGGDPKILAGYMVKNKGFLPSRPSEIPIQRNQIKDIIYSLLPACKEPDMDSGISFRADAIIANPPALKVPLHVFFTMPWTPTSEFPHPLSRVKQSAGYRNINFRFIVISCISDWGHKVDMVRSCFLDLASNYEPPQELVDWLKAGPKPIYIGFGSLQMTIVCVDTMLGASNEAFLKNLGTCFVYPVHHGDAGTTAAGLKAAGDRVHAREGGPPPIPVDEFSLTKLVDAISFMLDPKVKKRTVELAKAMENEDGVTGAVKAFFKHLPRKKLESDTAPLLSNLFSIRKCFGSS